MAMRMSGRLIENSVLKCSRFGRSLSNIPGRSQSLMLSSQWSSNSNSAVSFLHPSPSSRSIFGWWQRSIGGALNKMCGHNSYCKLHTENDMNLSNFLNDEIKLESENKKQLPPKITDFSISKDDSNVTLTKSLGDEKITVKFNVNHSVNTSEMTADESKEAEMVSKPPFTVEITKGGRSLAMSCVFTEDVADPQSGEQYADTLEIEEVCLHGGDWKDQTYAVSADIMDGNLYDHFLNLLEDRGIDEQFVEQLIEYSTNYEHERYIDFLQKLQTFVQKS